MAKRRRSRAKRRTGGALAPAHCKASFRACMRKPAERGAGKTAAACLKVFNSCRLGRRRKKSR